MCLCCPTSPKCVASFLLRVGIGGALVLYGASHYLDLPGFVAMTADGFTGPLMGLAKVWAYVLPALMIVGGGLLVAGYRPDIAAWCAGVALASIILGMGLKMVLGAAGADIAGPAVQNALLWLLIYFFAVKALACGCCGKEGHPAGTCMPGGKCG